MGKASRDKGAEYVFTRIAVIDVPRPPSVNRIWRSRKGASGKPQHYLDKRYADWKRTCDQLCMAHAWHKFPIRGEFIVTITIDETRGRKADLDNLNKAPLDFLQRAGIIENDKMARLVVTRWGSAEDAPAGCRIDVREAPEELRSAASNKLREESPSETEA